ncbi:unnamed protein product [Mytilus edulis]|uniref:DNA helicase Pif1-like 2B domain-containing protein n=1 Tax=Mytilus edulis TaxID=6550 RepID=A0A8S3PU47_MYTED|nr:unnamed protein product [Mytilus edulis]
MRFKQGKNVSIVCSTGIAATHYGDLRAQTLHKWSGVEDGRHLNEEIIHFVKTDERFTVAKHNIETVETLIIDESSMISAKIFNQSLQGDLKVYVSQDEGSQHYLSKFLEPKNLGLKLGCPVMLIKNLNDILVNGLCGTVTKLNTDSVEVKFTLEHKTLTVTIAKEVFTTFDPVDKIVLAKRVQLPLKVGFAITIHKAQGMTIENLVVDCNNSIQPGQLGVAIGRAVSIQDSTVIFDRLEVDSDFSESEIDNLEFIENILGTDQELLPDKSGSRLALDTVLKAFTDTPVEANILVFSDAISKNYQHFHDWFQAQCSIMEDIGLNCFPEGEVKFSQKHRNDYFIKFNKHINSKEYEDSVIALLNYYGQQINGPQFQLLTSVMFYLEKDFFKSLNSPSFGSS